MSQPVASSQQSALPREIAGVRIPDSALAKKAVDLSFRVSPAVVNAHVMRTFVFGALFGHAQKLRYDGAFLPAAVLHDLGLTPQFRGLERFEVVGADAADAFLKDQGVNPERREIIWDAIALHTSIGIASRKRPEIALVHIGAGLDVIGRGLDNLPKNLVAETIEALPRHDFNNAFFKVIVDTIAHAPQSAAMTWLAQTANAHVPGCPCPSLESQLKASPQRMTRSSITACAYPRWSAPPVVCCNVSINRSSVAVTVLTKSSKRNLIHQKQRIWTIFRRTKRLTMAIALSSVEKPESDRRGRFAPCRPQWK